MVRSIGYFGPYFLYSIHVKRCYNCISLYIGFIELSQTCYEYDTVTKLQSSFKIWRILYKAINSTIINTTSLNILDASFIYDKKKF